MAFRASIPRVKRSLGTVTSAAKRRAGWLVRSQFPDRHVVREVQGVRMVLPWSHRLPDYARAGAEYGQNLVALAGKLAELAPPLTVLDIGANVGDSALQILNAADGRVLCVEGDTAYLEYLHLNTDGDERVEVVEALLTVPGLGGASTAVRTGGTTRFTEGPGTTDAMPFITPDALREQYPAFADLRLVKSDTDGYDVAFVPAIAKTWADSRPVLFFEYDPYLIRLAGLDPKDVWPQLEELGYRDVAVWDHGGRPVGRTTSARIGDLAAVLDDMPGGRPASRGYWDVAAAHQADAAGLRAIEQLVPDTWPVA